MEIHWGIRNDNNILSYMRPDRTEISFIIKTNKKSLKTSSIHPDCYIHVSLSMIT
jgi:hypothetical protein